MKEKMSKIVENIAMSIDIYKYTHNEQSPDRIYMSKSLLLALGTAFPMDFNKKSVTFCGVPVQEYKSIGNRLEYSLSAFTETVSLG